MRYPLPAALLGGALCLLAGGCQRGQPVQVNFLLGYAHLDQEDSGGFEPVIDSKDGVRAAFAADVPVAGSPNGSGFRLGGRLSMSSFTEDLGDRTVAGEPDLEIEEFLDLTIFAPQFVASYRQLIGDPHDGGAAFIEPGLGVGLAVAMMTSGSRLTFGDSIVGSDVGDTDTELGVSLNPFVRGGYAWSRFLLGLEGGYEWSSVEFEDLGSDPTQWYVGLFFAMRIGE